MPNMAPSNAPPGRVNRSDDINLVGGGSDQPQCRKTFFTPGGRQPRGRADEDQNREQECDDADITKINR